MANCLDGKSIGPINARNKKANCSFVVEVHTWMQSFVSIARTTVVKRKRPNKKRENLYCCRDTMGSTRSRPLSRNGAA